MKALNVAGFSKKSVNRRKPVISFTIYTMITGLAVSNGLVLIASE
jgi:hypothetical protein